MYYPIYPEANIGQQQVTLVTGLFEKAQDVEDVLQALEKDGYGEDDIAVAMSDETRGKSFFIEKHSRAGSGAAGLGVVGGITGAIIAGIMGTGTVATGGLNLVVAGPILSALAGFGAGSIAGGFFGALIGAGIPEYDVEFFRHGMKEGNVLIAVKTDGPEQADIVKELFEKHNVVVKDEESQVETPQEGEQNAV